MKLPYNKGDVVPVRDGYGKALLQLGINNSDVLVLDADLAKSTRSDWFAQNYPLRFFDVGIAEQNMVGVASGLSLTGHIPFITTYSVFVTGRAFDQIRNTVCFSNLNVKIVGSHSGLSVGPDGGSHQCLEDIALMNVLPNMTVLCPCDANEAYIMTLWAADFEGPVYIRLAREATEVIVTENYSSQPGRAVFFNKGKDGYVISHSVIGSNVSKAIEILEKEGLFLSHVNFSTIKPLDICFLESIAHENLPVFIIEEHFLSGSLTSIIATWSALNKPIKIHSLNLNDTFGESGSPNELYDKYGFTPEKIASYIENMINR